MRGFWEAKSMKRERSLVYPRLLKKIIKEEDLRMKIPQK